jgi:hypothetical protein
MKRKVPQLVRSINEFQEQWNAFTTYLFDDVDWTGMFVAGGSVLGAAHRLNDIDSIKAFYQSRFQMDPESFMQDSEELFEEYYIEDKEGEFSDNSDEEDNIALRYSLSHEAKSFFKESSKAHMVEEWADSRENMLIGNYEKSDYNGSDIDLFLYGMNEAEAENKIRHLYDMFKKNLTRKGVCATLVKLYQARDCYDDENILMVRTNQTVTFYFKVRKCLI